MAVGELMLLGGLLLIGLSIYLISNVFVSGDGSVDDLSWTGGDEPDKSKSKFIEISRPIVHKFCLSLVKKVKFPKYRQGIKKNILSAGLSGEINEDEFIGMQILWGLLFPLLLVLLNFTLELGYSPVIIMGLGLFGFYFPKLHVDSAKKKKTKHIINDLPFFIDLLALSTQAAGMDFITAIERVVDKAENSVLADELRIVLKDIKIGSSRSEALKAMADRLDISEVTSFVVVVVDAEASGTSVGEVLKQQSVQMRLERLLRAEKAGARASQLILLPLMLFILPAVFIMVFGPVILQFISGGG